MFGFDMQVAFIQVMKVATPLFTLCISAFYGLDSLTTSKCVSMSLILFGSGLATFAESSSAGFSWYGFSVMLFSALLESIKVVLMQNLLVHSRYSPVELMVYLGPPTAVILASASYCMERNGLLDYGLKSVREKPLTFLLAIVGGFGVNLSTSFAIERTSGLTFKVWGCMKNSIIVIVGCLMGDHMGMMQASGYAISTVGFILYSKIRMLSSRPAHRHTDKKVD